MDHTLRVHHHLDLTGPGIEQPAGLDQLQALVHHACRVDGNLAAHRPVRVGTGLLGADIHELGHRRFTKRPAGGGQQDAAYAYLGQAAGVITRQALEDRVVLTVDRQQYSATAPHCLHEQGAGHHQRFLVGQQHLLARLDRRQGRTQAGGADNRRHHGIDLGSRSHLAQALLADQHLGARTCSCQTFTQLLCSLGRRHHGKYRGVTQAQCQQLLQARIAAQGKHLVTIRVTGNYIEGAKTNGNRSHPVR